MKDDLTFRDTIVEEIHRIREQISDKFGGDIAAISEDARRRQAASGRPIWQRPTKTNSDNGAESRESDKRTS
jgi:hypothetical protein